MLVLFDVTCIAFLLAIVLTPVVRNTALRYGLVDQPDASRKLHALAVPRLGGVAVALAYVLALVLVFLVPYRNLTWDISSGVQSALRLAPAALIVWLVGLADDLWGLKPWQKLLGQSIAAVLAYFGGFGVQILRGSPLSEPVSFVLTIIWLVGCANALNLIDGMDGLASGVGLFSTLTMLVAALVHGSIDLALVTAPLAGALLGFLRYNFNPASIFLGDSGSLLIGFLLGCFGSLWSQKSATVLGMTAPLLALAMPLLDTTLAIVRRFLRGQPIFAGDRGHIHHRLQDQGLTPRRVVLLIYGVCGVAAGLSLLQDIGNDRFGGLIIIIFCIGAWMGVQHLGYAELGIASGVLVRGTLRNMVRTQLQLQAFERRLWVTDSLDQVWNELWATVQEFGLAGARMQIRDQKFCRIEAGDPGRLWQLRVPLEGGHYVNLYHDPARELHPILLNRLPQILQEFLNQRFKPLPDNVAPGRYH